MEQLALALRVIYDKRSSFEDRRQAQAHCDAFMARQSVTDGLELFRIASIQQQADEVRLFALGVIDTAVKKSDWVRTNTDQKQLLKNALLAIIQSHLRSIEPSFVKGKVVSIVCEVAKREWPQLWPEFSRTIPELLANGGIQAEVTLRTLAELAESCTNSDFNCLLPPRRRSEILTEMRDMLKDILPTSYRLLEQAHFLQEKGSDISCAVLELLTNMSDFTPIQFILDERILLAIVEFTKSSRSLKEQNAAWLCLQSYARKPIPERGTVNWVNWVESLLAPFSVVDHLPTALPLLQHSGCASVWPLFPYHNAEEVSTKYAEVHLNIALTLSNCIHVHITSILAKANEGDAQSQTILATFLELLFRMYCHASITIKSSLYTGTLALLKCIPSTTQRRGDEILIEHLLGLMRVMADTMIRVGHPHSPEQATFVSARYSMEEFDDESDYEVAMQASAAQMQTCFRVLAKSRPVETLEFLLWRNELLFLSRDSTTPTMQGGCALTLQAMNLDTQEEYMAPRDSYVQATMVTLLDSVTHILTEDLVQAFGTLGQTTTSSTEYPLHQLARILDGAIIFEPRSGAEWTGCANLFGKFSALYCAVPIGPERYLAPVLEKLFVCARFREQREIEGKRQGKALSNDTLLARRRACLALVEVCDKLSGRNTNFQIRALLASMLPTFCNQVLLAINDTDNKALSYESLMMYEVLVLVSNTLEDANAQNQFLADLTQQPLTAWTNPQFSSIIRDPQQFREAIENQSPAAIESKRSLTLLIGIARRSKASQFKPFARYWSAILPNLFAWIHMIHYMWRDRTNFAALLSIHPDELHGLLGRQVTKKSHEEKTIRSSQAYHGIDATILWKLHFITTMRDALYGALGLACKYRQLGMFQEASPVSLWQEYVFADLDFMEHRHLARFITVVLTPFVNSCPENQVQSVVFPILFLFLEQIKKRLGGSWDLLASENGQANTYNDSWSPIVTHALINDDMGENDENSLEAQQEIARDSAIHQLGASYVDFLNVVLSTDPPDITKDPKELSMTKLCRTVLDSEQMAGALLLSLVACLYSPDAVCSNKAVGVTRRILYACLLSQSHFHRFVADQLFCALFGCLFQPKTGLLESSALEILLLLTNVWIFVLCGDSTGIVESKSFEIVTSCPLIPVVRNNLIRGVHGLTEQAVIDVEMKLAKASSEKGKRNSVKEFIQSCIHDFSDGDKRVLFSDVRKRVVQDLPVSRNVSQHKPGHRSWHDATSAWDTGVAALFAQPNENEY